MARADLLTDLVRFGMVGDAVRLRRVVEAIIAEEKAKKHTVLAGALEELLRSISADRSTSNGGVVPDQRVSGLLQEVVPERTIDDLVLPQTVVAIVREIVQEHYRVDLLRSYNLEPRNRILLIGPPGNGKTALAEALARALMVPLFVVRYEGVVGTYLGETAVRLRRLMEHVSTRHCVLFFDEFETLGKERGDSHETGEIKRVVSSLLMQIDSLPTHVVVVGATNHAELLDRAVWRRFQVRMTLPAPTRARLAEWFASFERRTKIPLGYASETLAKKLYGVSFAEAEEFGTSVLRQYVLEQPDSNMRAIVDRALAGWAARSARTKQQNGGDE
jgi:SpoVK/Ycf46/Vps4 family AAA+-type ATPase